MALTKILTEGIKDGEIVNVDINANAQIARTKLTNVDLVDDTSPQLGGHLDVNDFQIKNGTSIYEIVDNARHKFSSGGNQIIDINGNGVDFLHGNNTHADNVQSRFGSGNDLRIYHDGNHSYIDNVNTGDLQIRSTQTNGDIHIVCSDSNGGFTVKSTTGETLINAVANSDVELYYDGSKKLSSTQYGIEVHGTTDSARIDFLDAYANSRIGYFGLNRFGIDAHDGLEIRDPSDSYATRFKIDQNGHVLPGTNNTYDLGSTSLRWRNIYTNDLNLSNEGSSNDVDGTWGSFTIQEGAEDLFLVNKRNGKKYKFNLTEVA